MNLVLNYLRDLIRATRDGWDRFWFTPADPATLGIIRILAGAMLLYTHLVWSLDLPAFFSSHGWLTPEALATDPDTRFNWSHFYWLHSATGLWIMHIVALISFALLTVGLFSRTASILAFLFTVSYANRVPLAQFGLDAINCMLAMYLAVGPSGAAYSLDRLLARRRAGGAALGIEPRIGANLAIRLIQVHMCVIYLFSGLGKLKGDTWWEGSAIWGALANYEYQSMDMTWLAGWPFLGNFITQFTVAWEVSYCALIWPRWTRPIMIALAVPLHMGIACCMGMMTFGLVMLIGNVAFISPALIRAVFDRRPAAPAPAQRTGPARRSSGRASAAER